MKSCCSITFQWFQWCFLLPATFSLHFIAEDHFFFLIFIFCWRRFRMLYCVWFNNLCISLYKQKTYFVSRIYKTSKILSNFLKYPELERVTMEDGASMSLWHLQPKRGAAQQRPCSLCLGLIHSQPLNFIPPGHHLSELSSLFWSHPCHILRCCPDSQNKLYTP